MIIPALLVQSRDEFEKRIRLVEHLAPLAQIDIMDGTFVPQTCWAEPAAVAALETSLRFELHLMINQPVEALCAWASVPQVQRAIAHVETLENPREFIEACRALGWECGLALNPETPLAVVMPFFGFLDLVLFLGVRPGASGQEFIPIVFEKIKDAARSEPHPLLEVDGGVNRATLPELQRAGAQAFAASSAVFDAPNPRGAYEELQGMLEGRASKTY